MTRQLLNKLVIKLPAQLTLISLNLTNCNLGDQNRKSANWQPGRIAASRDGKNYFLPITARAWRLQTSLLGQRGTHKFPQGNFYLPFLFHPSHNSALYSGLNIQG